MIVHLCGKALARLGDAGQGLLGQLRESEHSPIVQPCLSRCQACDRGLLIAACDGTPVSAVSPEKLIETVAALAD